jgi:hypothetical protein
LSRNRGARLQSNVLAGFGCAVDTLFPWDKSAPLSSTFTPLSA